MSHQAQTWAVEQKVGDALAKAVLMNLANRADETGHCFPGQARISADTEINLRTVKRKLALLRDLGLISTYRRDREGVRLSDGYLLPMPESQGDTVSPRVGAKVTEKVSQGDSVSPSYKDEPSEEPSDIYTSGFGNFWDQYPPEGRQHTSRTAAHDAWSELSEADQQAALASLIAFNAYCHENEWYHPKNLLSYLRERLFENYRSGSVGEGSTSLIGRGSPEWEAWWPHLTGWAQRHITKNDLQFWTVPSAWPPGHEPPEDLKECA